MNATVSATRSSQRELAGVVPRSSCWTHFRFAQRRDLHAHQPAGLGPLADVGIRAARNGPSPQFVGERGTIGEGDVNPAEQLGIVGRVASWRCRGRPQILPGYGLVQPEHPVVAAWASAVDP